MKYLVTGITGFAAPHLANLLVDEGHEVVGLTRRDNGMETDILDIVPVTTFEKIKFVSCDIRNRPKVFKLFAAQKFDGVFHLAAQSHPPTSFSDPNLTFATNIGGSANLIDAITETQKDTCKMMFCSTSEVYGNIGIDGRKIKENDLILPANPYGVSKAAIDLYMQERMKNGYLHGFITRAFSHCGPRRGKNFSISSDAYRLARMAVDQDLTRRLGIGNLETTRVVMDVRDAVMAYYMLMANPKSDGHVYNVCGDVPRKMGFFTDRLIEISGLSSVTKVGLPELYRPHDIMYQHGDTEALKTLTGWEPRIDIDTTLHNLYCYWVGNCKKSLDKPNVL